MTKPDNRWLDGGEDALFTGVSRYLDGYPGLQETHPRIYVPCRMQGVDPPFLALLDTGAHFLIPNKDIAHLVEDHLVGSLGQVEIRSARGLLRGEIYKHGVTLAASMGVSLDIEATVFITPDWHGPSFIGYAGVLEGVRFAVDPGANRFYFGPLN